MTTPDHDPPLDDEPLDDDTLAVHAVVDDEASPGQRRRVARDPALVAQVSALRAMVATLAEPVEPPADDVLAAVRGRAIDAALAPSADEADDPPVEPPASVAPPIGDLGEVRARKARRLPPLPAVAAVVVLLVLVGVGLLVSDGGSDDDQADVGDALSAESGAGDQSGGEGGDDASAEDSSEEFRQELLESATARYASEEDLLDDLRQVDPRSLTLQGSETSNEAANDVPSTTAPSEELPGDATTTSPDSSMAAEAPADARSAADYATDPDVQRCDAVLRAAEPELEPVTEATLVEVDGIPVLVLSNPTEVSDSAPNGVRLTVLNAVDCSPVAAVVR